LLDQLSVGKTQIFRGNDDSQAGFKIIIIFWGRWIPVGTLAKKEGIGLRRNIIISYILIAPFMNISSGNDICCFRREFNFPPIINFEGIWFLLRRRSDKIDIQNIPQFVPIKK
jgi:hypothetical protein